MIKAYLSDEFVGNYTSVETAEKLLQSYANSTKESIELVDEDTGDIAMIHPITATVARATNTVYSFERVGVYVRVHVDDRPMILDTAAALNAAR